MRPLASAAAFFARRHLRGPLLPAIVALDLLVAGALPDAGTPGTVESLRLSSSLLLGAGAMLLVGVAAALPLASLGVRRGGGPGGALGPRGWLLASLLGQGLVLLLAACLLAAVSLLVLTARAGWRDGPGRRDAVRPVLASGPESAWTLDGGNATVRATFELSRPSVFRDVQEPSAGIGVRLRLAPKVLVDPDPAAPRLGSLVAPVDVRWRPAGATRWEEERATIFRGRPAHIDLRLSGRDIRALEISMRHASPGLVVAFEPGSIVALGPAVPFVTTFFRAFLGLGLAAFGLMAACHWLSGFVSYPLAVAGAATLLLVSAALPEFLPGVPARDPGSLIASGIAFAFRDLVPDGVKAGAAGAISCAAAYVDRRLLRART